MSRNEGFHIVVTGGAGYIGSVLTPMLLAHGHRVAVIDSYRYGGNTLAMCAADPKFQAVRMDIRETDKLRRVLRNADIIIPLAGLVGAPLCDLMPAEAEAVNLHAQLAIIDAASREQRIIMPTTESVYGSNFDVCTEDTPYNPLSAYGKHKMLVEQALLERGNAVSLRLATVFGMSPRMRLDLLVNDFTWRALKDRAMIVFEGHFRRTSVHVRDVAAAFLHAIHHDLRGVYNVGSVHCTKVDLCEAIRQQVPHFSWSETTNTPKDSMGRDPDQRDYIVSDAKIRATGYAPTIDLEAGISELLRGYVGLSNVVHGNVP